MPTVKDLALLILVGLVLPVSAANHASCTTSSDLEGQPASITCRFPEDISVSRHHVRVYKYDFHRQHYLPEIVGYCYWSDRRRTHDCDTVDGYQFDGPFSDTVTLTIPVSSQHHAGVYRCDYINLDYSPDHGCHLYVRGRTISCTGATAYEGDPANVTCHYNSDLSVTYDSFYIARWRPGHRHHRDVLTCLWLEPDLTKPDCSVDPDFKLSDKISSTVTIQIPAVNQSHVGRYFCDIVPTREDVRRPYCHVDVKGRTITTPVPVTSATRDTTATDHRATTASAADHTPAGCAEVDPEGQGDTSEDMPRVHFFYLILTPIVPGIAAYAVGILCVRCIFKKRYQRNSASADRDISPEAMKLSPVQVQHCPMLDSDPRRSDGRPNMLDSSSQMLANAQLPTCETEKPLLPQGQQCPNTDSHENSNIIEISSTQT